MDVDVVVVVLWPMCYICPGGSCPVPATDSTCPREETIKVLMKESKCQSLVKWTLSIGQSIDNNTSNRGLKLQCLLLQDHQSKLLLFYFCFFDIAHSSSFCFKVQLQRQQLQHQEQQQHHQQQHHKQQRQHLQVNSSLKQVKQLGQV